MTRLFGVVVCIAVAYVGVRVVATVVDIVGRWRRNDWSV
jgi:hypothetical protein